MAWQMDRLVERDFVDQIALTFEHSGMPPIAGRILGRLLVCDPGHQSSAQLADYLNASAGAVSTATRMLIQIALVERVRFRGDRAMYFRIRPDAYHALFEQEIAQARFMRQLAERGLELVAGAPADVRERVAALRDLYALFEDHFPVLYREWQQRRSS